MLNVCDLFLVLRTNTWLNCFNFSWDTRGAWINKHKTTVIYLFSVILVMIPRLDGTVCLEGLFHSSFYINKAFHFRLKCSVFSVQKHIYMSKHLQENAINQMVFERNFGNGGEIFIFKKLIACFVLRNNIEKVFVFFLPARFIIKKVIPVVLQKNWKHVFPTFPHCLTVAFRIIIFLTYNTRNFFFVWEFF